LSSSFNLSFPESDEKVIEAIDFYFEDLEKLTSRRKSRSRKCVGSSIEVRDYIEK